MTKVNFESIQKAMIFFEGHHINLDDGAVCYVEGERFEFENGEWHKMTEKMKQSDIAAMESIVDAVEKYRNGEYAKYYENPSAMAVEDIIGVLKEFGWLDI